MTIVNFQLVLQQRIPFTDFKSTVGLP